MEAERISTIGLTESEWLSYRHNGIGGSDVSSVLGLNPYKSSAELWWEKVLRINKTEENQAMHWGKALEDIIADRWQYWDGEPETMIRNFKEGRLRRKCRRVNSILTRPEYNWLFANVDRLICRYTLEGSMQLQENPGVLEIKTVSGWAADQWRDGIPPYYLIQLQTYLLVTGYQYGEIAILRDGRYMEVIPFNREDQIIDKIIEKTKPFWESVEKARSLVPDYSFTEPLENNIFKFIQDLPEKLKTEIAELEPAPDSSIAYENYLKDRYKIKPVTKQGTPEQLAKAIEYISYNTIIKDYETKKRELSNQLKNEMAEAEILDFGVNGKITHREDVKGYRRFTVKVEGGKE